MVLFLLHFLYLDIEGVDEDFTNVVGDIDIYVSYYAVFLNKISPLLQLLVLAQFVAPFQ